MVVETGDQHSASWQFTLEMSRLWKKKFAEKENGFTPKYSRNIATRFSNLVKKNSRFVIAPLDAITEQVAAERNIKVVLTLWESYLAVIDLGQTDRKIDLNSHQYWYVPLNSEIIPAVFSCLLKDIEMEWVDTDSQNQNADDVGEYGATGDPHAHADTIDILEYDASSDDVAINFMDTPWVDASREVETETRIILVETEALGELVAESTEGILFLEMLGRFRNLSAALGQDLKMARMHKDFVTKLIEDHPWTNSFHLSRTNIETVGVMMALFVRESEDPEFVEAVIGILNRQSKSLFPKAYIMDHLSLNETKQISPLFLHEGSIQYFEID